MRKNNISLSVKEGGIYYFGNCNPLAFKKYIFK
jgi:hypothetical protein